MTGGWRLGLPATSPYRRPAVILGAHLALFTVARAALLVLHRDDFRTLGAGEIAHAFGRGAWFDLVIIARVIGVALIALLLPFRWAQGRLWQGAWVAWSFLAFALFLVLHAADLIYFGHVHRHLGIEIGAVTFAELKLYFFSTEVVWTGLAAAALAPLAWLWFRLARPASFPPPPERRRRHLAIAVLVLAAAGVTARGGIFLRKSLHVGDAHDGVPIAAGKLVLSGPFAGLTTLASVLKRERSLEPRTFHPWERALAAVRKEVVAPGEVVPDETYPLLRHRPAAARPQHNVVVVMLESWDAHAVDCVRRDHGLPSLGVTPRFDRLAARGRLFTRCYSNGQRSLEGLYALTTGQLTLPGMPFLGAGLEQTDLPYLPRIAADRGRATYFVQGTGRYYQRIHSVASMAGFRTIHDGEHIPRDTRARPKGEGLAWDHETLAEAHRVLSRAPRPFLAFVFTSSTHDPYNWPDPRWNRHGDGSRRERYLNSLAYADDALGTFFDKLAASGLDRDTIYLLVSDHGSGLAHSPEDPLRLFHVPCLLIAPGLASGVSRRVASHVDVLPTVLDLLGWDAPHAGLGRSLLEDPPHHGSITTWGDVLVRVEGSGYVLHDRHRRLGGGPTVPGGTADLDGIELRLLSTLQVVYKLFLKNRLAGHPRPR